MNYNKCPFCKSYVIVANENYFDGSVCNVQTECIDCGGEWEDCYELTARYTLSKYDKDGIPTKIQTFETYENKEKKECLN